MPFVQLFRFSAILGLAVLLAAPAMGQQRRVVMGVSDAYLKDGLDILAAEYMELHPDVRVSINIQPGLGYATWLRAAIAGGDQAPDIFNANFGHGFYEAGLIVPLNQYLYRDNPYAEGRWIDNFQFEYLEQLKVGADYIAIPLTVIEIGIYYNRDILRALGLEPPSDWNEFMDLCAAVRASGRIPVAVPADMDNYWQGTVGWMMRFFSDAYFFDRSPLVVPRPGDYLFDPNRDGLFVYDPTDIHSTSNVNMSRERTFQAILDGDISFDGPELREIWTRIQYFSRHWQRGFHGTDDGGANRLFLMQQAAMMLQTSAFMFFLDRQIGEMPEHQQFDWGVFQIPPVTDSDLAIIPFRGVGGALPIWGIVNKNREQSDLAADFLMYITTPRACRILLEKALEAEQGILGPFVINDVPLDPELQARFEPFLGLGREFLTFRGLADEQQSSWMFSVLAQDFMAGARTLDEFLEMYQLSMVGAIARIMRREDMDLDPTTRDNNEPLIAQVLELVSEDWRPRDPADFIEAVSERLRLEARRHEPLDHADALLLVDRTIPVGAFGDRAAFDDANNRARAIADSLGRQFYIAVLVSGAEPEIRVHRFRPHIEEVLRRVEGRRYSNEELRRIWRIRR